jgi:CBS domain containing-hemolysin-like protein
MNDFNSHTAPAATEQGNTEDPSSSTRAEAQARPIRSFWSRAARIWRPIHGAKIRQDLADALLSGETFDNAFSPEERAMLHNILRFREVKVEDVMVPRADIEAVDINTTIGDLMVIFEESGRSRMPVYSETLDDPRGMVHIRDLLSYVTKQARNRRRNGARPAAATEKPEVKPTPKPVSKTVMDLSRVDLNKTIGEAGILRKVLFVPPSMLASDLLERMQANRTQMALVIDEYGGTDGLASHEDIVEMVVGDIEDEHDDEEAMFTQTAEDVFLADARVELEELSEAIGPDFDVADKLDDIDTLGGLIFAQLGRIPTRGEVVQALAGFEFHILEADPRRIKKVRIIRRRPTVRRRLAKGEGEGATDPGAASADTPSLDS